jgi:hypothetical protein
LSPFDAVADDEDGVCHFRTAGDPVEYSGRIVPEYKVVSI